MSAITDAVRRRLDAVPAHHRPRTALTGAVVLAVASLALLSAVTHRVPLLSGTPGYELRAQFAAANQVNARTPVRVGGIDVGKVERVTRGSTPGTSVVRMRITDRHLTVKRDARAEVRWRTLLGGNMYIELQPGSASAPALGDAAIPLASTSSQVEFDDLTQIYDGGTADAQRTMLRELRRGFADPAATGRAVEHLGPAMSETGLGLQPLQGSQPGDLRRLVAATARTVHGLGRDDRALGALVAEAATAFAVTDAHRRPLGRLIEMSPAALEETRVTMRRLRASLDHLDPLVAGLRPGARALAPAARTAAPTLAKARAVLRELQPLLRDAGPTFDALRRAGRAGTPLIGALDPTVRRLDGELLPWLARRDPSTRLRNYESIGPDMSAVGFGAAEFNEFGNIIQFPVMGGPNSAFAGSGAARMERTCRRSVAPAKRRGCHRAASLLVRILGGRR